MARSNQIVNGWTVDRRDAGRVVAVGAIVAACSVLRPLRDEQAIRCGTELVTLLFAATFAALVIVTAAVAAAGRRFRSGSVARFTMAGLASLALVTAWMGASMDGPSPAGAALVVSHGVLNIVGAAMAWQMVIERTGGPGRSRAIAAATIGAGIGSIVGPLMATVLVDVAGPGSMVPVAAALFASAIRGATGRGRLAANNGQGSGSSRPVEVRAPVRTGVRRVGVLVAGWSAVSTVVYFLQVGMVGEQVADPRARVAWFASIDLASNAVALLVQLGIAGLTSRREGLSVTLAIGPLFAAGGFTALWLWPDVGVLAAITIIGRAGGTALFRPGRELLLASCNRPVSPHARCAIDGVVYRAADAATAASIGVLSGGAPTVGMLAFTGTATALTLAIAGFHTGRIYENETHVITSDIAPRIREASGRHGIDDGLSSGTRSRGDGLDHATHCFDRREDSDRRARHLADFRRRARRNCGRS